MCDFQGAIYFYTNCCNRFGDVHFCDFSGLPRCFSPRPRCAANFALCRRYTQFGHTAYHTRSDVSDIKWTLSEALAPGQPIRRLVFALFLAYTSQEKRVAAFLYYAPFGPVRGLDRASLYHFDIPHSKLTAGEVLLLCDLAQGAELPVNDPIAALKRRDVLLSDLYARGFLSQAVYSSERDRALSLSVNPIPVK